LSEQNTIVSTRLADAHISYIGDGDLAAHQRRAGGSDSCSGSAYEAPVAGSAGAFPRRGKRRTRDTVRIKDLGKIAAGVTSGWSDTGW